MTSHCAWFCLFLRASPDHNNRRKARKKKGKICYSFPPSSIRHINSVLRIRTGKKNLKERERELEGNDMERKQKTKNTNDLMIHFRDEPRRVRMVFHKGEKGEVIIIFWCTETHTRKDTV